MRYISGWVVSLFLEWLRLLVDKTVDSAYNKDEGRDAFNKYASQCAAKKHCLCKDASRCAAKKHRLCKYASQCAAKKHCRKAPEVWGFSDAKREIV